MNIIEFMKKMIKENSQEENRMLLEDNVKIILTAATGYDGEDYDAQTIRYAEKMEVYEKLKHLRYLKKKIDSEIKNLEQLKN